MAGVTTEQLFLQVDASVELLRRNLAAGEQPLDRFEQRTDAMAARVDKSIGGMGKSFGAFAQLAETAAQKAERSFHDSFDQIQRMAAKAIESPRVKDGVDVGAAEARKAANLAQQQATAIGLIEQAAMRAAAGEGMLTAETRSYLQAASAARIEAEQHAAALVREAGALERLEIELKQAGASHVLLANRQKDGIAVSGQVRAGMQQLGFQANDVAVGIAASTPPMIIFAQQSGQVIQAISLMAGESKGLLGILGGPWGIVITTALVALTPFVGKLFEGNDALEKSIAELKKDAEQTVLTAKAKDAFAHSAAGLAAAVRDDTAAIGELLKVERSAAEQANISARSHRDETIALRQKTIARLADAKALLEAQIKRATGPGQGSEIAALGIADKQADVRRLEKEMAAQTAAIAAEERNIQKSRIALAEEAAKRELDPIARINRAYDEQVEALKRKKSALAETGAMVGAQTKREFEAIERNRKAALQAEQERQSRANQKPARQFGSSISSSQAATIVRGIGGQVNSSDRTFARQKQLYDAWVAQGKPADNPVAVPGTSAHERGNALDVQMTPGMSVSALKEAFAAQGVALSKVFIERGHYHIEWGKQGPSAESTANRAEAARVAVLKDENAYTDQERQARHRLLDATRKTAASEEERDRLLRDDINAEADATNKKIANQASAKEIEPAQAAHLVAINEATRLQRLQNVQIDRASEAVRAGGDAKAQSIDEQLAALQIEGDLAKTQKERRDVELRILALQEQRERILQQAIIDDPKSSPVEKDRAGAAIGAVDAQHAGKVAQIDNRTKGPWDTYLDSMRNATGETEEALEQVAVNGMTRFNDQLTTAASKILKIGGAFGEVANQIISDLIRIAIQEAATAIFGGGSGGGLGASSGGGGIPIGNIFSLGGISGGAFANGGDPPVGRVSLVGERGPELFVPKTAGTILPNGQSLRLPSLPSSDSMRGGGGMSVSVSMPVTIDAAGADPAALARVEQTINQHMVQLPAQIIATVNDGIDRGYVRR